MLRLALHKEILLLLDPHQARETLGGGTMIRLYPGLLSQLIAAGLLPALANAPEPEPWRAGLLGR